MDGGVGPVPKRDPARGVHAGGHTAARKHGRYVLHCHFSIMQLIFVCDEAQDGRYYALCTIVKNNISILNCIINRLRGAHNAGSIHGH